HSGTLGDAPRREIEGGHHHDRLRALLHALQLVDGHSQRGSGHPMRTISLSIRRTSPTRAATAIRTSPSSLSLDRSVPAGTAAKYSGSTPREAITSFPARSTAAVPRSPAEIACRAASSPARSARAFTRSAGV